ncbi:bifunctional 5,10-methylenetetrahydrofolate dehydrogenase/5,10-methenyltetrahydrofolate cyclohydrolase [Candidatus Curtissbacteria bacterium]|nr:bifunctional 5,10-methylenetetrahydrofolate dehydrogenase/5,10-methenyltetrahydrofolate cyclohydrolase [Candidatus Curtissbacteria bacterium]
MATILDGKAIRDEIAKDLSSKIQNLKSQPKLAIIQIGDVPESNTYIGQKIKFGQSVGAIVDHIKLPEDVTMEDVVGKIEDLNSDTNTHGIIVQLPIPQNLDKAAIIESITPEKDVDGLHSVNVKKLLDNDPSGYIPATTKGVITMLEHYNVTISGKNAVVIGRSALVGKPTALALLNHDATVTVCHSQTKDLPKMTQAADIIISAVGSPGLVTKKHVKPGQVVVDVGTTIVDGKLKGDVAFEEVEKVVEFISPVPGGAGPLTVASLFQNLLKAYEGQNA